MKKNIIALLNIFFLFSSFSQAGDLSSTSNVDWTKNIFSSSVMLDLDKAGISMPAGKMTAVNKITMEIPDLIKDPLLSLYVNSDTQLADLVLSDFITLEQIIQIINSSKKTPGIFVNSSSTLKVEHSLNTLKLSSLLIRHKYPYKNPKPIDISPSR